MKIHFAVGSWSGWSYHPTNMGLIKASNPPYGRRYPVFIDASKF